MEFAVLDNVEDRDDVGEKPATCGGKNGKITKYMNTMLEVDETGKENKALEMGKSSDEYAIARVSIQFLESYLSSDIMTSLYPTSSENTPSDEWDIYFYNQFEGPERLNTKLIRGLVARICSSSAMMMRRIKKRSIRTPYLDILSVLKYDKVTEDLKYVASIDAEVRELIVGFVRNRESILGEARKEAPAMEEESSVKLDEDGRMPMVSRARTFKQIIAEIGTSRSRRVKRAMQRVVEGRPLAAGDEDGGKGSDEQSDTGLEVLVMENQGKVWASSTKFNQADESQNGRNIQGSRIRPANWLERLQNGNACTIKTPTTGSSDNRIQGRAESVPLQEGHQNEEIVPCSRAKSEGETDENEYLGFVPHR